VVTQHNACDVERFSEIKISDLEEECHRDSERRVVLVVLSMFVLLASLSAVLPENG